MLCLNPQLSRPECVSYNSLLALLELVLYCTKSRQPIWHKKLKYSIRGGLCFVFSGLVFLLHLHKIFAPKTHCCIFSKRCLQEEHQQWHGYCSAKAIDSGYKTKDQNCSMTNANNFQSDLGFNQSHCQKSSPFSPCKAKNTKKN